MNKNYIYDSGDQRIITKIKLKDGDNEAVPVNIDTGATVQATLYQGDCAETSTVTVSSSEPDSDWANGVIVPVFPSSDMELLTVGKTAEMQVSISGDPTSKHNARWTITGLIVKKGY